MPRDGEADDTLVSRSIIGGEFTTEFLGETQIGPYRATQNRVSGQCRIYAIKVWIVADLETPDG